MDATKGQRLPAKKPRQGEETNQAAPAAVVEESRGSPSPSFRVSREDFFQLKFPHYSQPREVGCMSRDAHERWHNDSDRELRYFKEPVLGCNLSTGFETFVKKDEEKEKQEHIIPILSWLQNQRIRQTSVPGAAEMDVIAHPHFVAWRGMFARVLCTPYNRSESWRFLACRYKGTIYLAEKETDENLARKRNQSQREELMGYWGYKFEDYATRPRGEQQETDGGPVSNVPCYCTVIRARLGSHLLLMSGETDCCLEGRAKPPDNYVELKTNKMLMTERDRTSFERYKLLKFWSQSFLAGIPRVVVGFRDDEGIVRTVQHFKTLELPSFVEGKRGMWDSAVCMNFCDQLLAWVAGLFGGDAHLPEDEAKVVWTLDFRAPFSHVDAACVADGSLAFLPAWFTSSSSSSSSASSAPSSSSAPSASSSSGAAPPPQVVDGRLAGTGEGPEGEESTKKRRLADDEGI